MPSKHKKTRNKRNRINKRKKKTLKFIQSGGMNGDVELQEALEGIINAANNKKNQSDAFITGVGTAATDLSTTVDDVAKKWAELQKQLADANTNTLPHTTSLSDPNIHMNVIDNYFDSRETPTNVANALVEVKGQVAHMNDLNDKVNELTRIINDMGSTLSNGNGSIKTLLDSTKKLKDLVEPGSENNDTGMMGLLGEALRGVSNPFNSSSTPTAPAPAPTAPAPAPAAPAPAPTAPADGMPNNRDTGMGSASSPSNMNASDDDTGIEMHNMSADAAAALPAAADGTPNNQNGRINNHGTGMGRLQGGYKHTKSYKKKPNKKTKKNKIK